MHNVLRMSRRAFTVAVVAATIAWSIGLAALVAPLTANAAGSGDLVRGSLPAVYYVGADGKRYVFPNEKTYMTWYSDFSTVQVVTDAELAAMPIGGNVTYRPGVKMVKIQTDPKTYAVDQGGVLRWVMSEAAAVALYGAAWNTMVEDVPDAFFVNYSIGADVSGAADFNAASATAGSTSINADKGLAATVSGLSVALSSGQPVGGTLPLGATGVTLLKVDVHNGGSATATVDSVTLRRSGAGVTADWSAVYVYNGANRLTTGRTINSTSHEVTVGGLNLSVSAGGTESLLFYGDVAAAATAGDVHNFQLTALTSGSISASGTPLVGSSFTISGASAGNIAVAPSGTLSNVRAGETGAKLAQFQLTANVESQSVQKVVLSYNGTVTRENISNLVLKQGGTTLASASSLNSKDQAVFVLATPYYMERGNVRTLEVYGDVNGSARAAQTINFYLDQNADLLSVGQTYGYGVRISANTYTSGAAGATATVEAGRMNITYNGPAAGNMADNAQDVELFNFTVTPQSNLEIRTITFGLAFGGAAVVGDFADLKLVDTATGSIVAGPYTVAATVAMTEVINLTSGVARTFKLTVDGEGTASATETITATLNAFGATHVRNLDNSTYLTVATDIVPAGAIAGQARTVQVPSLTVSSNSTPVAQTYIMGSSNVSLAGIGLTAGDAAAVTISQIVMTGYVDDVSGSGFSQGLEAGNSVATIVQTAKLMNGATQLGATKSPTASAIAGAGGVLTFDSLNLVVPAGETVSLTLVGNIASALSSLADDIRFSVAAASITAADPDGNTVSQTGTTTGTSPIMAIAAAGTLTAALAPDDADSEAGLVIGGTSNAVLAKIRFTAQNEELKITKSRFTVSAPTAVGSLSVYDGSTLIAGPRSVTGVTGIVDFTGMNFVIPKDSSKVMTIKGNLSTVGSSGATSGVSALVTFDDGLTGGVANGTFEARGTSAGSSTLATSVGTADIVGNAKILRKTKPTVSLVSLPSTTLTAGSVVVAGRFSVTADAAGDVAMKRLSATVTEGIANAGITVTVDGLRRVGDSSNLLVTATGITDAGGAVCDSADSTCTLKIQLATEEVVSAGTTRTYDIRLTVGTGAALTSGDTLTVGLLGDTTVASGELEQVAVAPGVGIDNFTAMAQYNFLWSDRSLATHNSSVDIDGVGDDVAVANDWTNGTYVKVLPADGQTMSK